MSRVPRTASTLVETYLALRSGATTASELLHAAVARMGATRHLNAFIGGVLPSAKERAEASDRRRAASRAMETNRARARVDEVGETNGLATDDASGLFLDGAPIAVKDNFFVPGAPTTAGSKMLRDFAPLGFESTVTRRLTRKGAVVFGKTNMDEFGMGSENKTSAFGAALNNWTPAARDDPAAAAALSGFGTNRRVSGGSSGGSAVAVSSGAAIAAIGSDTGGSVRLPASYCGVVGFKPSFGRISRWGLIPYCSSLDCVGFLSKTVEDCVVLVSATQGVDRLDAATLPRDPRIDALAEEIFFDRAHRDADDDADDAAADGKPDWNPETSFTKGSRRDARARGYLKSKPGYPLWGWRVGVPAEFFISELSEEVKEAWIMTGKVCESLGARLVPMNLPGVKHALAAYYVLAPAEASSNLARYDGVRFGVTGTDAGLGTTGTHGDLGSSPFHAAAAASRLDGFGTEVRRRVLAGTFVSSAERASRYVEKARKVRRALSDDFSRAFQEVDILLTPTTPTVAPPSFAPEHRSDATRSADSPTASAVFGYAADCMTVPASLAGLPAVSLPVGLGSASGLPVGMQIIAARGGDADVLGFALSLEKAIEKLGEKGGGGGPGARLEERDGGFSAGSEKGVNASGVSVVGWGARHRAVGVFEASRLND